MEPSHRQSAPVPVQERAASEARIAAEREFIVEVVGGALGEMRHAIETANNQSIEAALAPVQSSLESLRQDMTKRAGVEVSKITELPNPMLRYGTMSESANRRYRLL